MLGTVVSWKLWHLAATNNAPHLQRLLDVLQPHNISQVRASIARKRIYLPADPIADESPVDVMMKIERADEIEIFVGWPEYRHPAPAKNVESVLDEIALADDVFLRNVHHFTPPTA